MSSSSGGCGRIWGRGGLGDVGANSSNEGQLDGDDSGGLRVLDDLLDERLLDDVRDAREAGGGVRVTGGVGGGSAYG